MKPAPNIDFLNTHNLRFIPGILLEDGDFTTRAYLKAEKVVTTDYMDYQYRIRPGSILTSNNAKRMSESEEIVIRNFEKTFNHKEVLEFVMFYKKLFIHLCEIGLGY